MIVIKEEKEKSRVKVLPRKCISFLKNLFLKNRKPKIFLYLLLSIPFLIGAQELSEKSLKILPRSARQRIEDVKSDLNLSELLNLQTLKKAYIIPINYFESLFVTPEVLTININQRNFKKIKNKLNEAKSDGILINDGGYEKASLEFNNKRYPINIRLKGDNLDHLSGSKLSFRVKIRGDRNIMGMKKFSLQSPRVRSYASELIYQKLLSHEGLPSLRYTFVRLILNGKDLGVYAVEEHFDKFTVENNRLREGIIVALDESQWWLENNSKFNTTNLHILDGYAKNRFARTFDNKRVKGDKNLNEQFAYASNLLQSFVRGNLQASDVFEIDKLGKFLAINDFTGSQHALHWNNLRFIYNPVTQKLIPIGFDLSGTRNLSEIHGLSIKTGTFFEALKDLPLSKEYLSSLERISDKNYLEGFVKDNENILNTEISKIHKSYPWTKRLNNYLEHFFYNQKYIAKELKPIEPIKAYVDKLDNNNLEISILNKSFFPIKINKILYENKEIYIPSDDFVLPSKQISSESKKKVFIELNGKTSDLFLNKPKKLKISYSLLGSNKNNSNFIDINLINPENVLNKGLLTMKPNSRKFKFLIHDDKNKIIKIAPGNWQINNSIIIPNNYVLKAGAGVSLNMKKNGIIISRSPIEFIGTEKEPIQIYSEENGMGLIIQKAKTQSLLHYVKFQGISSPTEQALNITGSVTFNESPVSIKDCIFEESIAEDALNIIRSQFKIVNSKIINSKSDGIDIDFGDGYIDNLYFESIGNDALDISGTKLLANNLSINGAGDKGISVGESSDLKTKSINIQNAGIGIASKDSSKFYGENVSISSTKLSLAAYQKKPEYGPSSMILKNLEGGIHNVRFSKPYILESFSTIVVDKISLPPNTENAYQYLYESETNE